MINMSRVLNKILKIVPRPILEIGALILPEFMKKPFRRGLPQPRTHSRVLDLYNLIRIGWQTLRKDGWGVFWHRVKLYMVWRKISISLKDKNLPSKVHHPNTHNFSVLYITMEEDVHSRRYRVDNIIEQLRLKNIKADNISISKVRSKWDQILDYDIWVFFRLGASSLMDDLLKIADKMNIIPIIDFDDYVFNPRMLKYQSMTKDYTDLEKHYWVLMMQAYQAAFKRFNYLTTSTDFLVDIAKEQDKKAFLIPNGLNKLQIKKSREALNIQKTTSNEKIKVGYFSGTKTHQGDFKIVEGAILKILKEFPQVEFDVYGYLELGEQFKNFQHQIKKIPFMPWQDLPKEMAKIDINIAPLELNPFNEAKSNLKYYEAGLLKIPTLASPTGVFKNSIINENNGVLVKSSNDWYESLKKLIINRSFRKKIGVVAYRDTLKRYTPEVQVNNTIEVYKSIIIDFLVNYYKEAKYFVDMQTQYNYWLKRNYPKGNIISKQNKESKNLSYRPKISIIIPTYNTPIRYLQDCLESVKDQSYDNWEVCIADDASKDTEVRNLIKNYAKEDQRIKYTFREKNGHICAASSSALKLATGAFVALLDHDDVLWPNALFEVVKLLNTYPKADFIYSDEDKLVEDGKAHVDPFFKPDWSPDYLRSTNYICHFTVIKKELVAKVGGFRKGFEGAQDWDLFLRVTRETDKIYHIPKILYSWRKSLLSTASEKVVGEVKDYAYISQKKALQEDLKARGYLGEVLQTQYKGYWRIKYQIIDQPMVSIIIPTKDNLNYIKRCVESILNKSTYQNYEIIIIDTGSTQYGVKKYYKEKQKQFEKIKIISWDKEFNFSSVCNFGAKQSRGDYLLFLNNDTEIINNDWIEGMLELAQLPKTGAVGCKLFYPNGKIQHAGIIWQMKGLAGHAFRNNSEDDIARYFVNVMHANVIRNYIAVTAACLMIKRDKFEEVEGFDEKLRIAFNDVDFCIKLWDKGYDNIFTPFAKLYHHESISVGTPEKGTRNVKEFLKEIDLITKRWKKIKNDPFYNPNLNLNNENFDLKL